MDFKGKVVLITGGAGGIGKALARTFLEKGSKVSICDINEEEAANVLQELGKDFEKKNVIFSKCDVTRKEDFEEAYEKCENSLGAIDILINNAGIIDKDLRKTTEVIQFGTINGTEIARKKMGKCNGGKGGFVVNIASMLGVIPNPMFPFYASAKAAIVHYSRIVGSKVHRNYSDVSVLCLCPGAVDAPLLSLDLAKRALYDKHILSHLESFHEQLIFKLEPKEIGEAVIKMINENKSGEVAVIDKSEGFFYVPASFEKSYGEFEVN